MALGLFWRLTGVLFLFFTVLRLEFLFWNRELYSDESWKAIFDALLHGLRFDAVPIGWMMFFALIWGWAVKRAYWIPVFLLMFPLWVLSIIDIELWNFFGRRMSLSVLKLFREADGKMMAMAGDYVFWILTACGIASVLFAILWRVTWDAKPLAVHGSRKFFSLKQAVILVIIIVATRGGLQKKPLTPVNAHLFEKAHLNQLVLNTPFTLMKSLKGSGLSKEKFFTSREEALKYVNRNWGKDSFPILPNLEKSAESVLNSDQELPKQNVVVLILESFSWEYSALNPKLEKNYMPFLNSLMEKSLTFSNGMANGRRSIEGVGALLAGVPALMEEPFITSEFSTNSLEGLGSVFEHHGYSTSFFHGGDNGTMHFDAFTSRMGFKQYFGSREYPNSKDHDGVWGIWDRPYLQYFTKSLSDQKRPFLSVLFTLSSHQPYEVPREEKNRFPEQEHPILKAVSYTDSSLQDFFQAAEKQSWFQNTLFVIVADHTGPLVFHRQDQPLIAYRIPILFYHPQIQNWPEEINRHQLVQQIDIPASLYDFLDFSEAKTTPLSRSVFRPGPKNYTAYAAGVYWHTDGENILTLQGKQKSFAKFSEPLVNVDLSQSAQSQLETELKAVKEVYSFGLWDNDLYMTHKQ